MSTTTQDTRVAYKGAAEGEVELATEAKYEKIAEPKPDVVKIQTFTVYEVVGDEDFSTLVPNESERMNIVNRGLVLKQQSAMRGLMLDKDFEAVDGSYDLAGVCAESTERRAATPVEKAKKIFAKLSPEELAALFAEFQGATASASASN